MAGTRSSSPYLLLIPHKLWSIAGSCGGSGGLCGGRSTAFPLLQAHVFCEDSHPWNAMLNQVSTAAHSGRPRSMCATQLWAALNVSASHTFRTSIHQFALSSVAFQLAYHCVVWSTALPGAGGCAPSPATDQPAQQQQQVLPHSTVGGQPCQAVQCVDEVGERSVRWWGVRRGRGEGEGRGGETSHIWRCRFVCFAVGLVGQSKLESYGDDIDAAKQAFCKK